MHHKNFYSFQAATNYELGQQLGFCFKEDLQLTLKEQTRLDWPKRKIESQKYLPICQNYFSQYIEELRGYAKGAGVDFLDLWCYVVKDELDKTVESDHCTSIITNHGQLISHNEDWHSWQDKICLLKKTIKNLTIFEIYYYHTLGGCAVSINSFGFAQLINTLHHPDWQIGIPRNMIARWLSETQDPEKDFQKLKNIRRSSGYNHNIITKDGQVWNIESTATKEILIKAPVPFIHTNHYLTSLKQFEQNKDFDGSEKRYQVGLNKVKAQMSEAELIKITNDQSYDEKKSIMNDETIGKMLINFNTKIVKVWLLREQDKGWIDYKLDFLK